MISSAIKQIAGFLSPIALVALMALLALAPKASYADLSVIERPAASALEKSTSTPPHSPLVNINTASPNQLLPLKGIGPSKAKKIVLYRSRHGAFKRLRDLRRVKGIGKKTLKKLRPFISLNPIEPTPKPIGPQMPVDALTQARGPKVRKKSSR